MQFAEIAEQGACRARGHRVLGANPESLERLYGEVLRQRVCRKTRVELPELAFRGERAERCREFGHRRASRHQDLARREPRERGIGIAHPRDDQPELAGGQISRRDAGLRADRVHRTEEVVAGAIQQVVAVRRARRDRLDHGPLDDALGKPGILHLLTDRDAKTLPHEPPHIVRSRLHRHAGEWHIRRATVVA